MLLHSRDYLKRELDRLDLLLHRQILRLRASYQLSLDEFRGLYVSDQQVDNLVSKVADTGDALPDIDTLTRRADYLHRSNVEQLPKDSRWCQLAKEFGLSGFELDLLLLAVAPEFDLKYETLFGYLNNDVTRKQPTFDLALRIFTTAEDRITLRKCLLPDAPLFRAGLLRITSNTSERPPWLSTSFCLTLPVSEFLLGFEFQTPCSRPETLWDEVPVSNQLRVELKRFVKMFDKDRPDHDHPIVVFEGRRGTGRRRAAEAISRCLGLPLVSFDLAQTASGWEQRRQQFESIVLRRRLWHTAVYLQHAEALFDKEGNPIPEADEILNRLVESSLPLFLSCAPGAAWRSLLRDRKSLALEFADLAFEDRLSLWTTNALQAGYALPEATAELLASRFVLTAGQIRGAVNTAIEAKQFRDDEERNLVADDLIAAARAQSDQSLGNLSLRVRTIDTWNDLVLPRSTLKQVKEVAAAIKYRHVVYSQWGFEKRIAYGKGLKVLFAGPSGTGKTMTAGVIARDLGFDLYKIDLSSVVSKYIGETEKNLDRIFRAAHSSNAILFFDEADALFGKRSEVKDAHDRYANIEVAYLLQKLEEHEGAVILASNLSKNIDDAFSRRMHYVVEFPLPGEPHREQLWRGMFPPEVPLSPDVDFCFLAKQFHISGGDIKNVVLASAFLAAQDGQVVTMKQIVTAMARQMSKRGRIPSATDFKQYHVLIEQA